jgi:cytidylate kinase
VVIDQKRILEEEERKRQIEEAQAQIAEQEKEEMERFRATLALEVDVAMSKYSTGPNTAMTARSNDERGCSPSNAQMLLTRGSSDKIPT